MGAGSAKGVKPGNSEDADRLSTTSEQWETDHVAPPDPTRVTSKNTASETFAKTLAEVSEASGSKEEVVENNHTEEDKKEEPKKKTRFGFTRKKEDDEKADELVVEFSDEKKNNDKNNVDKSNKDISRKDADKKGFRLFNWKKDDKKNEEKDEVLDKDIDELEKTFDSLGIVGQNTFGEAGNQRKDAADDLELLQPMRKRNTVRGRGPRGPNGTVGGSGGSSNGSTGSKRAFKFSWETENDQTPSMMEEDEWEYKAESVLHYSQVTTGYEERAKVRRQYSKENGSSGGRRNSGNSSSKGNGSGNSRNEVVVFIALMLS
nr:uncharacterized protein LOC128700085 [Cherax quadricarinatus]